MSNVTREEVIELLRNFQQRMAAKRGMCDEHDGALWDNAESVIAALQAAEPAAWLFPDMTWTPISAMGRDHKGKEVFALPCPPAKAQVPEGWKLVPVEPTDHMSDVGMVSAGIDITENDARHVYSAMLDASPQPAPAAVPEGWQISRTEGGNIIVQKSHVAGFVASEQGGGIAESTLYYLADDLLTASPAPDHAADVRKMVAPDVSELEKAAQTLWRESYSCESDFIQAVVDAFSKQEEEEPVVQQHYPCGCVTCICEDDVQCQGCGGTSCDDFKGPSCGCTHQQEEAER